MQDNAGTDRPFADIGNSDLKWAAEGKIEEINRLAPIGESIKKMTDSESSYEIKRRFSMFGAYILLAEELLLRSILSPAEAAAVSADKSRVEALDRSLVDFIVSAPLDDKIRYLMGGGELTLENVNDNKEYFFEESVHFPEGEAQRMEAQFDLILSKLHDLDWRIQNTSTFKLLLEVVGTVAVIAAIYWICDKYLWTWLGYVFILGYIANGFMTYSTLNKNRQTIGNTSSVKYVLAAFTTLDRDSLNKKD